MRASSRNSEDMRMLKLSTHFQSTTSRTRRACHSFKGKRRGPQRVAAPATVSGSRSSIPALTTCTLTSVVQVLPQPTRRTIETSSNQARSQLRKSSVEWISRETRTLEQTHQCRILIRSTATDTAHTLPAPLPGLVSMLTVRPFLVHGMAQYHFLPSALDQA